MSATNLAQRIADADRENASWRQKLLWLRQLVEEPNFSDSESNLVLMAIYLRYLATGGVACKEDGRHFRPSHHAQLSQEIHGVLAKAATPRNRRILRQIYPYLPSFDQAFTRREPLTRIRDIAHRNDIPQDLKKEIKTRLQNKLHRCADPGDLKTSTELLARVTAPGTDYSRAFVEQFEIFHGELEEFFGAQALGVRLDELVAGDDPDAAAHGERYRTLKTELEATMGTSASTGETAHRHAELLLALVVEGLRLRQSLSRFSDGADETARRARLTDIGIADHTFVLASQFRGIVDPWEPATFLPLALQMLESLLAHLELDGWVPAEALVRELVSWGGRFEVNSRDHLLRLKAFVERVQQHIRDFADAELARYVAPAQELGHMLHASEEAISAFTEGYLRGGLSFQVSALAERVAKRVREAAKLSPWIALYVGSARGRLRVLDRLEDLDTQEATIAIVKQASGDETIPETVHGIVLAHEIPQLSHLGVRVRQSGVVFACCEAESPLAVITQHEGHWVELNVSPRDAQVLPATQPVEVPLRRLNSSVERPIKTRTQTDSSGKLLLADDVIDAALGGHKAATVGQLYRLSQVSDSFAVPRALVVPFSALDSELKKRPQVAADLAKAMVTMSRAPDDATRTVVRVRIRDRVNQLELPPDLVAMSAAFFGADARLMVRSSACLEDQAGAAGAGVYESVANVPIEGLDRAIKHVWASLWNERAIAAREQAGVDHKRAQMAVLIQQMVTPDLSFIMHTVNPISGHAEEATVELAVGHGEVLASARLRGAPFRLVCNKSSGHVTTESFASFDRGLWPAADGGLEERAIDYSEVPLMSHSDARRALGRRLGDIAKLVERELGGPQDVEGLVAGDTIYLVQSRVQQGLGAVEHSELNGGGHLTGPMLATTAAFPMFGLFDKQIEGDDTLFALGQRRFREIGLGAEFHGADPERLDELWRFSPQDRAMLHLPRGMDLLNPKVQALVVAFAGRFAGRIVGMVIHDQWEMVERAEDYRAVVETLSTRLSRIDRAPKLQIEFAVGLEPREYIGFFEHVQGLPKIGACLDIGHVGIWYARRQFASRHAGEDVCALTPYDPRLPELIHEVEAATRTGLDRVLEMIRQLGAWHIPTHFHLHDGHPLWTLSPYRNCDHMSFLEEISIPFTYEGRRSLSPLYGPSGLAEIICAALSLIGADKITATLEIHPLPGQQRLTPQDAALFGHWREKTNAEQMNYWLSVLSANFDLLKEIVADGGLR